LSNSLKGTSASENLLEIDGLRPFSCIPVSGLGQMMIIIATIGFTAILIGTLKAVEVGCHVEMMA